VHAARATAVCLATSGGFAVSYTAQVLGPDWAPRRTLPLAGIPSRARISRDGTLVATTSFIRGDSYASAGQFSTRTLVSRADGGKDVNIEEFALQVNGKTVTAADRNLWGVTFVDADHFYATAASGAKTWLVRGSLNARSLVALQEDAECPSVSPDGGRIVYKKRGRLPPGQWRLTAYDIGTGAETPLAETRSVDDQVDWLDATHVIYGLARPGAAAATSDVWSVPVDGGGAPQVLVHDAWSPAVVRWE
jgi:dipeptidyl aminopeptidase/acylaminoacyl peptidase